MRILLVGDFRGSTDEGMSSISRTYYDLISAKHQVFRCNTRQAIRYESLRQALRFRPQIVHYITGPTLRSLIILKLLKLLAPSARTISSATRPFFSDGQRKLIGVFRPDLFLTQDPRWEHVFTSYDIRTEFVPNGVDSKRFRPVASSEKLSLQRRFGFPAETRTILHVGHLRQNRNLEVLVELQQRGAGQVVVVSGTAMKQEEQINEALKSAGCLVIDTFQAEIEQIYAAADVYVFPVPAPPAGELPREYNQVGAIDMPLSVLEAMATNLPVVSTPFPALKRIFSQDGCLRWFNGTAEDCLTQLQLVGTSNVNNSEKVQPLDWPLVVGQLEGIYADCLAPQIPVA